MGVEGDVLAVPQLLRRGPDRSPRRRRPRPRRGPGRGPRRSGRRRNSTRRSRGAPPQYSGKASRSTRPLRALTRRKGPVPTGRSLPGPSSLRGTLDREEGLGQRRQQCGVGAVEGDLHHVRADALGPSRKRPLPAEVLHVAHHRVGVERSAVVEDDPLAQGEGPGALVPGGPGRGQGALRPQGAGAQADERLTDAGDDLRAHQVGGPVGLEAHRLGQGADDEGVGVSPGRGGQERDREEQCGDHATILPGCRPGHRTDRRRGGPRGPPRFGCRRGVRV